MTFAIAGAVRLSRQTRTVINQNFSLRMLFVTASCAGAMSTSTRPWPL